MKPLYQVGLCHNLQSCRPFSQENPAWKCHGRTRASGNFVRNLKLKNYKARVVYCFDFSYFSSPLKYYAIRKTAARIKARPNGSNMLMQHHPTLLNPTCCTMLHAVERSLIPSKHRLQHHTTFLLLLSVNENVAFVWPLCLTLLNARLPAKLTLRVCVPMAMIHASCGPLGC